MQLNHRLLGKTGCFFNIKAALLLLAALMPGFALSASSQPPILIGQSCDLSGATASRVKEYVKGVDAYLAQVNAQGGVLGRPIKLVRYDDAFNAEKGLGNAKRLAQQDDALLFFGMGSAQVTATILPYAAANGIPVFGSLSGADSLRKSHPMLIHIRASFGDEVDRLAQYFSTVGVKRIAALAAEAPIGQEGVIALERAAKAHGLEVVKIARVSADLKNLDEATDAIAQAQAKAVLVLAPAGPAVKFVEALKQKKVTAQLAGLSVMSNQSLYQALGTQVEGMIITQVVPFPWGTKLNVVRDYQKLMQEAKITPSIDTMEGYMSVRLLVEGLKAAGPVITRKSFMSALEAMNQRDIGGLTVTFSGADRSLVRLVDITMISTGGKLIN